MKIIKMRYSIEPRDFCPLIKTWVKVYVINTVKKFFIALKKSPTDAIKPALKRAIQKIAEATVI